MAQKVKIYITDKAHMGEIRSPEVLCRIEGIKDERRRDISRTAYLIAERAIPDGEIVFTDNGKPQVIRNDSAQDCNCGTRQRQNAQPSVYIGEQSDCETNIIAERAIPDGEIVFTDNGKPQVIRNNSAQDCNCGTRQRQNAQLSVYIGEQSDCGKWYNDNETGVSQDGGNGERSNEAFGNDANPIDSGEAVTDESRNGFEVCGISISHSGNAVAVAISDGEIGIDIERVKKCTKRLIERIIYGKCDVERTKFDTIPSQNSKHETVIDITPNAKHKVDTDKTRNTDADTRETHTTQGINKSTENSENEISCENGVSKGNADFQGKAIIDNENNISETTENSLHNITANSENAVNQDDVFIQDGAVSVESANDNGVKAMANNAAIWVERESFAKLNGGGLKLILDRNAYREAERTKHFTKMYSLISDDEFCLAVSAYDDLEIELNMDGFSLKV